MKLIAYIRVSTEEQALQGVSLAAQEAKLRQYATLYDHQIEIIVDAGHSAKTLNRPGLTKALQALDSGEAEGILVLKLDRLTRSIRDLNTLLERYFTKFALLSVVEQLQTHTAAGRLILNLLISVSQFEVDQVSERTKMALAYKKSIGVKLGAPALDDPDTLHRIRCLKAMGLSMRAIAQTLTQEGFKTKRGGSWQSRTVKFILEREVLVPT